MENKEPGITGLHCSTQRGSLGSGSRSQDSIGSNQSHSTTYRATIRTPIDSSRMDPSMNSSLTALEGEETTGTGKLSNLTDRAKEMAGTAVGSMLGVADTLKSRASNLGEQIGDMSTSAKEVLLDRTHRVTDRVKNFDYDHVVSDTRTILGSDPARTMLIAGGIGLALGFMMGRKH